MRRHASNWTYEQVMNAMAILNLNTRELAQAVGCAPSTASHYKSGKLIIPAHRAEKLVAMIKAREHAAAAFLGIAESKLTPGLMIQHTNQTKVRAPRPYTLLKRGRGTDWGTKLLAPYRLHPAKFQIYLRCLAAWGAHIREKLKAEPGNPHLEYERTNLAALLQSAVWLRDKGAPYDVCPTATEFATISSALRHPFIFDPKTLPELEQYALYQHWRRHKVTGYPIHRSTPST